MLIANESIRSWCKRGVRKSGLSNTRVNLRKIGITDVIHPERQVAQRMGVSLVRKGLTDVFDLGEGLAVFEVEAPEAMIGYTLKELKIRKRYNLNLITIKRMKNSEEFENIGILTGSTKVKEGDHFILVGNKENCDKMMNIN